MSISNKQLMEDAIQHIKATADDLGISPCDVSYNQLVKYAQYDNEKRAILTSLGGFAAIKTANFPPGEYGISETQIDKTKIKNLAAQNKKEASHLVKEAVFAQDFEKLCTKLFDKKIVISNYNPPKNPPFANRELNLLISDTHFGSNLTESEVGRRYGFKEEARRLAQVVVQAAEYKLQYRAETTLRLHLMGDIVQGNLHETGEGLPDPVQAADAIYLLAQAIGYLANLKGDKAFRKIIVDCSPGNHGRDGSYHKKPAVHGKVLFAKETVIFYALKAALINCPNVEFHIAETPYITYDSFGDMVFGTHGDTVLKAGNVGNSIDVKGIENQINRINSSMPQGKGYRLFFVGHVHIGCLLNIGNRTKLITNGALIPPDSYSLSIGIFENTCGQTLWESVPGYVVGDYRYIKVDESTDRDSKLELIIKPFSSL